MCYSLNQIIVMGRLTADPEVDTVMSNGNELRKATFALAQDRNATKVNYFDCVAFGERTEQVEKLLHKGSKIVIEGELSSEMLTYADGSKHMAYSIIMHRFFFAEDAKKEEPKSTEEPPKRKVEPELEPKPEPKPVTRVRPRRGFMPVLPTEEQLQRHEQQEWKGSREMSNDGLVW